MSRQRPCRLYNAFFGRLWLGAHNRGPPAVQGTKLEGTVMTDRSTLAEFLNRWLDHVAP